MKGFLSSLKKLTTNDTPTNQPTTPSNIAVASPATPSSASSTDIPTPKQLSSTPSHSRQSSTTPSNKHSQSSPHQPSTPSHAQQDDRLEAAKKSSKQIRMVTDNLITLSATIFDHSKFINNQSTTFAATYDTLALRELEADLGRAEVTTKSILVDMPNLAKLSQEDISSTNSLLASNLDFCKALRSRGAERLAEHRKLALLSDERLKRRRAELNTMLKAEWEAGVKLHEYDTNALMSKYGARPINALINQPMTHSAPIDDDDAEIETSVDPHLHDDEDDLHETIEQSS